MRPIALGHLLHGGVLAELKRANVRGYPPPVLSFYARSVAVHGAKSVGNNFKEVPGRRLPHTIEMERRRRRESALHDQPLAAARIIVASSAIDVVTLASSLQICARHRKGEFIGDHPIHFAGIEQFVRTELPARHGTGNNRALRAAIIEEIAWFVRKIFWLYMHVEPAADQQQGNSAEANEFAYVSEHTAHPCFGRKGAVIKIKLQFQRLPGVAKFNFYYRAFA